jgi:hypothetical protein
MLRILGNPKTLCNGVTRRDLLEVGGLSLLGLGLTDYLRMQPAQASPGGVSKNFGKAKSCILLFPFGSPSQHETFDPKPLAPLEIRGEMGAINTAIPGVQICDHLPRTASMLDRLTVVRSMTHQYPLHGVAYAVSGIPLYDTSLEERARDQRHWPFIGSIVDWMYDRGRSEGSPQFPRNVALPWLFQSQSDIPGANAGPFASFLGQKYDPYCPRFVGPGTKIAPKLNDAQRVEYLDPFAGLTAEGYFSVVGNGRPLPEFTLDRLSRRKSLLDQFDANRRRLETDSRLSQFDAQQQTAFSLLTSRKLRDALDISREPQHIRDDYGMTLFGQSCLAARRLVEAGSKFVTVFWDAYQIYLNSSWDTHSNHYPRMKEYLLPGMDSALPALILDLESRGLLDETLVLWMSEHGRTPQIDPKPKGAGRHHWSRAYSVALAGAGIARGKIVGATDKIGGDVRDNPISPKDILATTLHLLGIDPQTQMLDYDGRPHPLAGDGHVRSELF